MSGDSSSIFLRSLGAFLALALVGQNAFSLISNEAGKDFEMLIVGDSLIEGQGLREQDKFSTLTKNWLEKEFFLGSRTVNLKNKSHSGARLYLSKKEIEALTEAEKDLKQFYFPEINFSFPSSKTQIDVAADEYKNAGKPAKDIDLIMVSGCLTNLNSSYIINPFKKNKRLREKIDKYCNHMMFRFLKRTNQTFPNALITVVGYYPLVSNKSSTGKIYNVILERYGFPRPTKPLLNNILTKQFFKPLHSKMTKRSRIWFENSNIALQTAVNRLNKQLNKQMAIFFESPIIEEQSFGTKNTLLFGMAKKGRTNDFMYDVRQIECTKAIDSVKDVKLKFNKRDCEISGVAHPNVEGSKAYAKAIQARLRIALSKNSPQKK